MKKGFSVLELVISLIVITSIVAAFTPLITKKFSTSIFGAGGTDKVTTDCKDKFGENCTLCDDKKCIRCKIESCPDGQYKDTLSCSCKDCKDKYGEDCEICNEKQCLSCPDGQYLDNNNVCQSCSDKFANCAICTENECLACDDGYILTDPTSNTPCTPFNCSGPDYIQIGNLCITKKNMGDGTSLTIPDGVNVVQVNQNCSPSASNFCCWQGATSGTDCDNANGGAYSGCNRTACDHYAAEYICSNFTAGDYYWRLPTLDEMSSWANYSIGIGINGLQLCDYYPNYSSTYCGGSFTCMGAFNDWCDPHDVWGDEYKTLWDGDYDISRASEYYLLKGDWYEYMHYRTLAFSTRCVTEMPESCEDKAGANCEMCDGNTCLKCASGYVLKNGKCEIDCASKFGSNCTSCTTSKCTACASGYILKNGACTTCSALFGANCTNCTSAKCTACTNGYELTNSTGNPACQIDFCIGDDLMKIDNLCVTKKNMGDSTSLVIPSGVTVVNAGSNCEVGAQKCCWQGTTSNICNYNNGWYGGCDRTICDWWAADYICKNLNISGKSWRLPTTFEMSNWGANSMSLENNGLQLCDTISNSSSAQCIGSAKCLGADENTCKPNFVWSGTIVNSSKSYFWNLENMSWFSNAHYNTRAFSVRCVTEL